MSLCTRTLCWLWKVLIWWYDSFSISIFNIPVPPSPACKVPSIYAHHDCLSLYFTMEMNSQRIHNCCKSLWTIQRNKVPANLFIMKLRKYLLLLSSQRSLFKSGMNDNFWKILFKIIISFQSINEYQLISSYHSLFYWNKIYTKFNLLIFYLTFFIIIHRGDWSIAFPSTLLWLKFWLVGPLFLSVGKLPLRFWIRVVLAIQINLEAYCFPTSFETIWKGWELSIS